MLEKVNLLPALLATLLAERGEHKATDIGIHPAEGRPAPTLREVTDTLLNPADGSVALTVRSKSEQRQTLEDGLPEGHELHELTRVLEREMTLLRIETALRERRHLLGLSPLLPVFFPETQGWPEDHKKILAFFLPYGSQIRGDMVLIEKCLQAALGEEVIVAETAPFRTRTEGSNTEDCILNAGSVAGGIVESQAFCVRISIGPVPPENLIEYTPGGRQRQFLEKGLLPLFLPENWEWETQVSVAPEYEIFKVAEPPRPLCAGINTVVR